MAIVYGLSYVSTKAATGEQVYIYFRIDNTEWGVDNFNWFTNIVDKDTGEILFSDYGTSNRPIAYFYWLGSTLIMPGRDWNLRIEAGTGDVVESVFDFTVPNVPFPSNRYMKETIEPFQATSPVPAGGMIPMIYARRYNRGTDICSGKVEIWDMNKGEICYHLDGGRKYYLRGEMIDPVDRYRDWSWSYLYPMPNEPLHLQARVFHKDPATGEYLEPDEVADLIIHLPGDEPIPPAPIPIPVILLMGIPLLLALDAVVLSKKRKV